MKNLLIQLCFLGTIALFSLEVAGCSPKSAQGESLVQISPIPSTPKATAESSQLDYIEAQDDSVADDVNSEAAQTAVPVLDGSILLEQHCNQCHRLTMFVKAQKTRSTWERILSSMERMGVELNDDERNVLIDYLADPDRR